MDLSLPIHDPWNNINNSSLEEALRNYVRPEVLDDDNKYECSGCTKKVRAVKGQIFEKLPQVLVIQLNRFTFNMYGSPIKVNDKITFPFILNMNDLMEENIDDKIKQTEQKIIDGEFDKVDDKKDDENQQDQQQDMEVDNNGAIALGPAPTDETRNDIGVIKTSDPTDFIDTSIQEAQERENMG